MAKNRSTALCLRESENSAVLASLGFILILLTHDLFIYLVT